jgi:predicted RNase H-like HicB family nuclease
VRPGNRPAAIGFETVKTLTAIIYPGETGRWLVAFDPETGTTTQGKAVEGALQSLRKAVTLYLEERPAPVRRGFWRVRE